VRLTLVVPLSHIPTHVLLATVLSVIAIASLALTLQHVAEGMPLMQVTARIRIVTCVAVPLVYCDSSSTTHFILLRCAPWQCVVRYFPGFLAHAFVLCARTPHTLQLPARGSGRSDRPRPSGTCRRGNKSLPCHHAHAATLHTVAVVFLHMHSLRPTTDSYANLLMTPSLLHRLYPRAQGWHGGPAR
jgi:hypothetical protein